MYGFTSWALALGCLMGGYMASMNWLGTKFPVLNTLNQKLTPFRTFIGIICLGGGILALFFPLGPGIIIIGDLIPAVAAILLGIFFVTDFMPGIVKNFNNSFIQPFHVPLGIVAMAVAVLHWFKGGNALF